MNFLGQMINGKYKSINKDFNRVTINEISIFNNSDFGINSGNFIV